MTAELFIENEEWQDSLVQIQKFRVLKMPRLLKSLYFLLGVQREDICFPGSSLLDWKKSKHLLTNKLPRMMKTYRILGAKPDEVRKFNTVNYVERIVSEFNAEEVENYNIGMGKLFKWVSQAVTLRKADIVRRKALNKKAH